MNLVGEHWKFALKVYLKPGVPDACIHLQDRCGVDINVLLVALYGATELGIKVDDRRLKALCDCGRLIRTEAVLPIREIRQRLKPLAIGSPLTLVRNIVKEAELKAEQCQQAKMAEMLTQWFPEEPGEDPETLILRILAFYRAETGEIDGKDYQAVRLIAEAARGESLA